MEEQTTQMQFSKCSSCTICTVHRAATPKDGIYVYTFLCGLTGEKLIIDSCPKTKSHPKAK